MPTITSTTPSYAMPQAPVAPPAPPVTTSGSVPKLTYGNDFFSGSSEMLSGNATDIATKLAPYVPGAVAGFEASKGAGKLIRSAARGARRSSAARYGSSYRSSSSYRTNRAHVGRGGAGAMGGIVGAIKSSVIVGGLISIAINGYQAMKGQQTWSNAGTNVVGDVAAAGVGGAAGAVASAIGAPILAGILGTGMLATLGGIGLGIGGYMLAENWFRNTPFFQKMTSSVKSTLASIAG